MTLLTSVFRLSSFLLSATVAAVASAGVQFYGDQDVLGTGSYSSDPTVGATLEGLTAGDVTYASLIQSHTYPFTPESDDFGGTDQIYVAENQTGFYDGYSQHASRKKGPQIFNLDYSSLVPAGHNVKTLTLGIAADDFQRPSFGQAFQAKINGTVFQTLTDVLNAIDQTGPKVQFLTFGIDTALLTSAHSLELSINQLGDGRDGWAVDYLSVGVTTESVQSVPEPATIASFVLGAGVLARSRRSRSQR